MTIVNMKMAHAVRSLAEVALKRNANQTTCNIIYQPKVPSGLNRYKKESNDF